MLSFEEFLTENKEEFNVNDAKGKLFEILFGSHFKHGSNELGEPNKFLSHYRDENNKSPKIIHDLIKSELEKRHPGMYDQVNKHAREASEHARNELIKAGHKDFNDVAWTSQKGDHERFTGKDDPNSDADVMVKTDRGPLAFNLKYGKSKNMNLKNNGLEELEKMAELEPGSLTSQRSEHMKRVKELGLVDHEDYKRKKAAGDPAAKAGNDSALLAQKEMARRMSEGLSKIAETRGTDFLKRYVQERITPKTIYQHYRLHARPNDKGDATYHMKDMQDEASALNDFEHLRVAPHSGGITFRVEGRRKGSDTYEPVLEQSIKKGSGPMKGFASMTKAPFLTKKKVDPNAAPAPAPKKKPRSLSISTKNIEPVEAPVAQPVIKQPKPLETHTVGGLPWKK